MNHSIVARSEVCQRCAKCCKTLSDYTYDFEMAKRLHLLATPRIEVKEFKLKNGSTVWRITYKYPCEKLKINPEDGKYYCELHGNKETPRPFFCKTYPDNMPIELLEIEKQFCPALNKIRIQEN